MSTLNHIVFENCYEDICRKSRERFEKESHSMSRKMRSKARKRMEAELNIIKNIALYYEFRLYNFIVFYSLMEGRLVSVQGPINYSYVAYLYGITTVDPTARDYPMEMAFGYNHDRMPKLVVYAPYGFLDDLKEYLSRMFAGKIMETTDYWITIGDWVKPEVSDPGEGIFYIPIFPSPLHSFVESTIYSDEEYSFEKLYELRKTVFTPTFPSGTMRYDSINDYRVKNVIMHFLSEELNINRKKVGEYCSFLDGTYEGVLRTVALVYGPEAYDNNLHDESGRSIFTIDDAYKYAKRVFNSEDEALFYVEYITDDMMRSPMFVLHMNRKGIPESMQEDFKNITDIHYEGSIIPRAQLYLYLAAKFDSDYSFVIRREP